MTFERRVAGLFRLDDAAWERHANPWSGWSRLTTLPLLILSFWSRQWLGWWALVPVAVALAWLWLNPHLFPPPRSTRNWMSQGVLGERVWLNRDKVPVPNHHRMVIYVLNLVSGAGVILVIWGVAALAICPTLLGTVVVFMSKLWGLDRMVWLYREMEATTPEYARWSR